MFPKKFKVRWNIPGITQVSLFNSPPDLLVHQIPLGSLAVASFELSIYPYQFYVFIYLTPLDHKFSIFLDWSDHIESIFLVIGFIVDTSFIHIYQIAYSVVMSHLCGFFLLSILTCRCFLAFITCQYIINTKVEYIIYTKDRVYALVVEVRLGKVQASQDMFQPKTSYLLSFSSMQ